MEARRAGEFILPAWSCRGATRSHNMEIARTLTHSHFFNIPAPPSELLCSFFPVCVFVFVYGPKFEYVGEKKHATAPVSVCCELNYATPQLLLHFTHHGLLTGETRSV
jgi:hypothetical protein